jgi:hypothetical protein
MGQQASSPAFAGGSRGRVQRRSGSFQFIVRSDNVRSMPISSEKSHQRVWSFDHSLPIRCKSKLKKLLQRKSVVFHDGSLLTPTRHHDVYSIELTGETRRRQCAIPVLSVHLVSSATQKLMERCISWKGLPIYQWKDQETLSRQDHSHHRRSAQAFLRTINTILSHSSTSIRDVLNNVLSSNSSRSLKSLQLFQNTQVSSNSVALLKKIANCLMEMIPSRVRLSEEPQPIIDLISLSASNSRLGFQSHPFVLRMTTSELRQLAHRVCDDADSYDEMVKWVMRTYRDLPITDRLSVPIRVKQETPSSGTPSSSTPSSGSPSSDTPSSSTPSSGTPSSGTPSSDTPSSGSSSSSTPSSGTPSSGTSQKSQNTPVQSVQKSTTLISESSSLADP